MYYLERACEIQVAAGRSDDTLIMAEKPTEVLAKKLQALRASGRYGELEWESLQRLLKKKGSDHAR
jgi:hypothetical protein